MLFYMYALKRFGKQLWKEPNTVMCASILMTLLGLPVLTIGIALCAGVAYMYAKEKGIETSFRMALREIRPCAGKALGGTMAGYDLLGQLGHSRTPLHPSLTQIRTDPAPIRGLKGVRADCHIRLRAGGRTVQEDAGEAQFTETGVSGPAAFTLSRQAGQAQEAELLLDLLRAYPEPQVLALLAARKAALPQLPAEDALAGMLHPRLGKTLCRACGLGQQPLAGVPDEALAALAKKIKNFALPVTGVSGFESAQVTAGGVRTAEFRADTLESRLAPGVFACGEVLDIDGDCGGFNLQWAWASGRLAGRLLHI